MMKALVTLFVMAFALVAADEADGQDFNGEFFQGMEAGFFLRDNPDGYKDYDCLELNVDVDMITKLDQFFVPIEMLLGLLKNDEVTQTFKTVRVVIKSTMNLVTAVEDYKGTEFCSGLLFGIHGSSMLLNIAKTLVLKIEKVMEDINDMDLVRGGKKKIKPPQ